MSTGIKFSVNSRDLRDWLSAIYTRSPGSLQDFLIGAGEIVYGELEKTTPRRSGYLWLSTITRLTGQQVVVKPTAFYAAFVEKGTAPHLIQPRRTDGVLCFEVGGETIFAKYVNHPGTRPQLFIKTARENAVKKILFLALDIFSKLYGAKR